MDNCASSYHCIPKGDKNALIEKKSNSYDKLKLIWASAPTFCLF